MGGSVFSGHSETVRVDRAEHDTIAGRVAGALAGLGIDARALPTLPDKASFGDVDLVTARSQTHVGLPETGDVSLALARRDAEIADAVGADAYHRGQVRNPALHMLVTGQRGPVQVDLVSIDDEVLDFASRHLSWGDAGSLAAAVGKQMGLKIGMTGPNLTVRAGATVHRARLDVDYDQALELMGLDAARHRAGFVSNEDIYAWLADGAYFDPRLWTAEWMTNRATHRAAKRDAHQGLLEWIERNRPTANYDWGERRGERLEEWTERLMDTHPEARAEITRQRTAKAVPQGLRAFFNGDVVRAHVDVDEEALPHLMNAIRKGIGVERLQAMADADDHDGLAAEIRRLAGGGHGE